MSGEQGKSEEGLTIFDVGILILDLGRIASGGRRSGSKGLGFGAGLSGDGLRWEDAARFQDDSGRSQSSTLAGLAFCILYQQVRLRSLKPTPRDEGLGFNAKRFQGAATGSRRRDLFEKLDFLEQVSSGKFSEIGLIDQ